MKIAFFGTPKYSLIILDKLIKSGYKICCCVTKPAAKIGRDQVFIPTPVFEFAQKNHIPVITPPSSQTNYLEFAQPEDLKKELENFHPDILITADYTQKIPQNIVKNTPLSGINVHPSLLPQYRGPAPVPWAIYNGETATGVSLITLAQKFDQGEIITQQKEKILATDTTEVLLTRLFEIGAELLIKILPTYSPKNIPESRIQNPESTSYYPRLTRNDGYEPWKNILNAFKIKAEAIRIDRKFRAFTPWPGLWTKVKINNIEKRLKILEIDLSLVSSLLSLQQIQLEGKQPISGKDCQSLLQNLINQS